MKKTISLVLAASMLVGCAGAPRGTRYVPVVDLLPDQVGEKYQGDLTACQYLADQRGNTAEQALAGALAGALVGALLAPRGYRNNIAGRTAVMGAGAGTAQAIDTQENIIKKCLVGRGYRVLN